MGKRGERGKGVRERGRGKGWEKGWGRGQGVAREERCGVVGGNGVGETCGRCRAQIRFAMGLGWEGKGVRGGYMGSRLLP